MMFFEEKESTSIKKRIVRAQKPLDYSSKPRSADVRRLKKIMAHRTVPFPLEKIRRQVLLNVHVMDKQIYRFEADHLKPADPQLYDKINDFLEALIGKVTPNAKPGQVTISQCKEILDSQRFSRIHARSEYSLLAKVLQAAFAFQQLTELSHKLVLESYNEGLRKYCISFFAEAQGIDLVTVRNYESSIQERSATIETILKRLDGIVSAHEKLAKDTRSYVREYEKVLVLMSEFCDVITQLEEPLKEWVFADREYVPQLLEESEMFRQELEAIRRSNKLTEQDHDMLGKKLQRKSWQRKSLEAGMTEEKNRLKTQRQRQKSLQNHLERNQALLECRLQELAHCKEKPVKQKGRVTFAQEESDRLSTQVDELTHKIKHIQAQIKELHQDDIRLKKVVHGARDDLRRLSLEEQSLQEKLHLVGQDRHGLGRRQRDLEAGIQALKRVRFIKLHPDTIRKIRLYGYLPHTNMDDSLVSAFRAVGECIGRHWPQLYMKLPFEPDRDVQSRKADLQAIASQTEKLCYDPAQGAVRGLEKWYRLSHCATLTQLLTTLRRINRSDVAKHVSLVTQAERAVPVHV